MTHGFTDNFGKPVMEDSYSDQNCSGSSSSSGTGESGKTVDSKRKWCQILYTLAICYTCVCGGTVMGYTAHAIPSIREGKPSIFSTVLTLFGTEGNEIQGSESEYGKDGVVAALRDTDPVDKFMEMSDEQASWIGGLAPLGAFFGCIMAPIPIRYLGPKGTILKLGSILYLISWLFIALSPSLGFLYLARLLGGLAMGFTFSSVPIYIVDISSLELRGPLGTLSQFLFSIGVLTSFILGYYFDWRMSAVVCGFLILPNFLFLPMIPESPAWLISKKRVAEAEASLQRIHGYSFPCEDLFYDEDSSPSKNDVDNQPPSRNLSKLLLAPKTMRTTFIALFLCIFQQLTGINAVNFYTVTIFEISAGKGSFLDKNLSAVLVASVFCLANVCSYIFVEKLGRKVLLVISTFFLSLSAYVLGYYFWMLVQEKGVNLDHVAYIPLVCLVIFVLAFSIGYGPLLYVIVAEILPLDVRDFVSPVVVGINWLCVFLVAKTFPAILHQLGPYGAFWMYGTFSLISLIFTITYIPETKGKTMKEIEAYFEGNDRNRKNENKKEESILSTELSFLA